MTNPSPAAFGLPHNEWRPNQYETFQWLSQQEGYVCLEAPTGSGKTGLAAALASQRSVTSLVKTKNLQKVNYGDLYSFDVLFGRGNYPCLLNPAFTAAECAHTDDGMQKCELAKACPYLVQKAVVQGSSKASLNYSYWLTARWPREHPPAVLVLDEADELPDIVADWAGCTVTAKDRMDWGLPAFPVLTGHDDPTSPTDSVSEAIGWLEQAREVLTYHWKSLKDLNDPKHKQLCARCFELGQKVGATLACIRNNSNDWYIRSGPYAREVSSAVVQAGFVCRPLTARYHFGNYFNFGETVILMSATIGQPERLAIELGLKDYAFRPVPSAWPPDMRQVLAPADAPALGSKAEPLAYEKQADMAVKLLGDCPPDWFGIVLVTSKYEAQNVAERLARRGLQDRVWVIPEKENGRWIGTDRQTKLWQERKRRAPGSLLVSYNHWRGYDGLDEKVLLVFKTPYPQIGSPGTYANDYMRYDGKRYHWRTANMLQQGCGRTRRGRPEDYGVGNGLVAVLDSNWSKVKKYLSEDWLAAVVQ
jgi:Rad3-related DNA helicase